MNILDELIGKNDLPHFTHYYFQKYPYAKPCSGNRFKNYISWQMLEEIVAVHNDCWLPQFGKLPDDPQLSNGTLKIDQIYKNYFHGRTLLVRHAEKSHQKIAEIAKSFHDIFHHPVDAQIYTTPKDFEGFDWHYDLEEVFIIQTSGEKEFRILPNTVTPTPLPVMTKENQRFAEERKKPEIRCWLKAGDFLYIPAGYWHKAHALTDSIHLSIGVLLQNANNSDTDNFTKYVLNGDLPKRSLANDLEFYR